MMRSLYAGISGLRNFQTKMDIIGNNIANVNTIAFKSSRVTFAETMAQTLAGEIAPTAGQGGVNIMQVGLGMRTLGVDSNFSQGSLEATGVTTDLAIQGDGFFMVTDSNQTYYTRAGAFHVDSDGYLVSSGNGYRVMGYTSQAEGGRLDTTAPHGIQIPLGKRSQAKASTGVKLLGNLDMNLTQSAASLIDSGDTGITSLSGTARDGAGGRHQIVITGANATRSTMTGSAQGLTLTDTLVSKGIDSTDGFAVLVDGERRVAISGLTPESTVSDLINAINSQVAGVEASLDGDGKIQIMRKYHGDGQQYNVRLMDPEGAGDGGIVANLFDADGSFDVNNGTASTLAAVDYFTPTGGADAIQRALDLEVDRQTGLVTGVKNLGGGGIFINAPEGLASGTALVDTAVTTHASSIYVYDSLGNTHNLTIRFTRSETPGTWRWQAELPSPAVVVSGGSGQVSFRDDGSMESFTYDGNLTNLVFNPGNGAQNVTLTVDAGRYGTFEGLTQTASMTSAMATDQDGYGMGTLQGIFIDSAGRIFGNYSNGVTDNLAQLLLANFTNPQGLERVGESLYRQTTNSGAARITDSEQAGARINSGYLEMSNVDLSREFTDMILAQRAFQASARVIASSDGLLEEVTRLKR